MIFHVYPRLLDQPAGLIPSRLNLPAIVIDELCTFCITLVLDLF